MADAADVDSLMSKMDRLQTQLDAIDGWEIDRQLERALDALRCPPCMSPLPLFVPINDLKSSISFVHDEGQNSIMSVKTHQGLNTLKVSRYSFKKSEY